MILSAFEIENNYILEKAFVALHELKQQKKNSISQKMSFIKRNKKHGKKGGFINGM